MPNLFEFLTYAIPVILAITLHEVAHGWVALLHGDDTAKRMRRLSLNPLKHVDRFGTVIMPGLLYLLHSPFIFGYAKPVPVDFNRLKPLRLGMLLVAAAGPLTNILLAFTSALLLHLENVFPAAVIQGLYISIQVNCVLATLNMLPLLPLDGGRVVAALLPASFSMQYQRSERFGFPMIILLLLTPHIIGVDLPQLLIGDPAMWLTENILQATGNGSVD